jgi:transposase
MFFVKMLTMVKNRVHTIVDRHPDVIGDLVFSDLFGRQGIEWLKKAPFPKEDRKLLDEDIDIIEYLRGKISSSDQLVASLGKKDKRVELLMTIPGIGKFFALLIVNEIGDIGRFRNKNKFASYAGLVPSVYASGGRIVHGRIVKSGNKYLRWALIEAVWPAIKKDIDLEEVYQSLKMRKGANQAKVAIARRLSVIVYRVLSQQRPYYISSGRPHFSVAEAIH